MARALSNPVYLTSPEKGVDGRTTLAGARAPLITDGRIGDFWFDTTPDEQRLYGPKNAGGWPDLGLVKGNRGWTPVFAAVNDGSRRVQRIVDWQGGEGPKPAAGQYVGATGLVSNVADAIDIRGPEGPQALINALDAPEADMSDETLISTGEVDEDNVKRTVVDVFDLGAVLDRRSVAHAESSEVRANVKRLRTQFHTPNFAEPGSLVGGANYRRVNSEPAHAGKFRSTDRWTAEGNSDFLNGGWWELAEPVVTVQMFGAKGDGVTDDTAAIADAFAAGGDVLVPYTESGFRVTSKLTVPGGAQVASEDGARLVFSGAFDELIDISGDDVVIANIGIDLTAANVPATTMATIYIKNRSRVIIRNPKIIGGPLRRAAIILDDSTYCQIAGPGEILNVNSTAIILSGTSCHDNVVEGLRFKGTSPGLHVLLRDGAHHNVIALNRCDDGGAELVGIEVECHDNTIANNYAYGCEDAGFSITGSNNLVIGNTAENCEYNGFAIFGARNTVVGNTAKRNGWGGSGYAGFSILSNFGGIASNNFLSGNFADDDPDAPTQDYLAKVSGDSYAEWAAGQSITVGLYRSYLDNLYIATTAGTTGATAPVHTSNSASDGGVTWLWVNSQVGGMKPTGNVIEVRGSRYKTAPYLNGSAGFNRFDVGLQRSVASSLAVTPIAHSAGQTIVYGDVRYVDVENVGRRFYIATSSGTTGSTPLTHTSGSVSDGGVTWYYQGVGGEFEQAVTTNRFLSIRNGVALNAFGTDRYIIHVNASPEGQVTADPGSLAIRNTGTALLGLYLKNSGAGPTGWLPIQPVVQGSTASRPALSGSGYIGFRYFDTTLGKPIFYNGSGWVDAAGASA